MEEHPEEHDYINPDDILEVHDIDELIEQLEQDDDEDDMAEEIPDSSVSRFPNHDNAVFAIACHPVCPHLVVSGGQDDLGYIWRADTAQQVAQLTGHSDSVVAVAWSHDGEYVSTGAMDGKVRIWKRALRNDDWEWQNWDFVTGLDGMEEIVWLDWHPKGPVLLVGTGDGTVWMYQLPSGVTMNVFAGHTDSCTTGKFLPDGKRFITASADGTCYVWDPRETTPLFKLQPAPTSHSTQHMPSLEAGGVTSIAINGQGTSALLGFGAQGHLRIVNLTNGNVIGALQGHSTEDDSSIEALAWAPTSSGPGWWISAGSDGKLVVYEASNGSVRWTSSHEDAITSLVLHAQSSHLISTASADRTLKTWDLRTGQEVSSHVGHHDVIHCLSLTTGGEALVSGGDDGIIRVHTVA